MSGTLAKCRRHEVSCKRGYSRPLSNDVLPSPIKRLKSLPCAERAEEARVFSEHVPAEISPEALDEICDSEDETASHTEDESRAQRPTVFENALPPIENDKEALVCYDAMRAAEDVPEGLKSRLKESWFDEGKSSIYVDAFNLCLVTVLSEEAHLFDEKEIEVFKQWRRLDYDCQYLYVRLFLRKTSAWHRLDRLRYHTDVADLSTAAKALQLLQHFPPTMHTPQQDPATVRPLDKNIFGLHFAFADSSEDNITTLEEALSLLSLEELKSISKEAKVDGKNKAQLLQALRQMSRSQCGLGWVGLSRSNSMQTVSSGLASLRKGYTGTDESLMDSNRDVHFLNKIMLITGPCIRLSCPALKLFERVHLVFYKSTEWTEKSLTTMILAQVSRRNFPAYVISRSANIFVSRSELLEFEAALRTQFRVDSILELNGNPKQQGLEAVLKIGDEIHPRWRAILLKEQNKENRIYESGEGAYLRRFSPAWVYTRILHKAAYALGRLKLYQREYELLNELLDQDLFHAARRGAWYQRKALLEEHYMYSIQPPKDIVNIDQQRRFWKRISCQTCEQGLQDRDCHMIYHYELQKRIRKLEKNLRIPKREQHDFGHVLLSKAREITVEGIQIKKIYSPPRRKSVDTDATECQRSTKTIWLDEHEGGGECSVEAMCLSWYRSQGMKGYHAEGGIIRTLFAYLFCDILFIYIPNVFQTAYQTCPLDLHTDAFYHSRCSEINHRLVEIANGGAEQLIREVDAREREKKTCIIGLNWEFELSDLLEITSCFDGAALATICKVMAQEYHVRGGGIPDLFLWDPEKKQVMFSEVKSETDRLSDTQRLWIHVLTGAGVKVELCNAVAREVRVIEVA